MQMRKPGDQGAAIARLELVQTRVVDDARDHFAHIEGLAGIGWNYAIQFVGRIARRPRCLQRQ